MITLLTESIGVHEKRWLRAFEKHQVPAISLTYNDLAAGRALNPETIILAGPLDSAALNYKYLDGYRYVLLSYAFDVLANTFRPSISDKQMATLYDGAMGVVFDSQFVADTFHDKFAAGKPYETTVWGLESSAYTGDVSTQFKQKVRELKELTAGRPVLFSARNFTPIHGTVGVVQVFERIAQQYNEPYFIISGGGPLESQITSLCQGDILNERCTLLGSLTERELSYVMQELADIYVSAAYTDGTSITLLQALEGNCALCLSTVGGNNDLNTGDYLKFFAPGDLEDMERGLTQLLSSHIPEKYWEKQFNEWANWENNQLRVIEFISELSGNNLTSEAI